MSNADCSRIYPIPTATVAHPAGAMAFHPVVCITCSKPLTAQARAACQRGVCPIRGGAAHHHAARGNL